MTKNQLNNHSGRFQSLIFREGNKTRAYCGKIIKITDQTIKFKDVNTGEIVLKKLASFAE